MYESILVPLDGSSLAELAIPYAEELARVFGSEVTLVYVCEPAQSEYRHMHQLYIDEIAVELTKHTKAENTKAMFKPVVLDGHPAAEITDYTAQHNISFVVMATHGRSGMMPWALGSTAYKVFQKITVPILLIRTGKPLPEMDKEQMFGRILIPLDGSEAGKAALAYVAALARKLATELILFQAVAPGQHVHTVGGLTYVPFPEQLLESMKVDTKQYLEKVAEELANTGATIRSEVRIGDTSQEIIKFADEEDIRLVAMSSHGHTGIRKWLSGSVTNKVLHAGNRPLLLVRSPD